MRFGGHQTFYVREGWLSKGLKMLMEQPERFNDPYVSDYLGVGRNMAKSIEHWLQATGLAEKTSSNRKASSVRLTPTKIGEIIAQYDKYFTHNSTWWFLHINLVCNPEHATTWHWFFNEFPSNRFDRSALLMALMRHEKIRSRKPPTRLTLERDISCFLGSYAIDVPYRKKDPEEEMDCPFQELRIIRQYRASGYYELNRHKKPIDPEVILYALNACKMDSTGKQTDIAFHNLTRTINGPLQTLVLNTDALFEHIIELEQFASDIGVMISGLAGDRQIRFPVIELHEIASNNYRRVRKASYA